MKKLFFPVLFLLFSFSSIAQTKVGTIDSDLIIASMTELQEVQTELQNYGAELDKQFKTLVTKYQESVTAFESPGISETDKQAKQEEAMGLEEDIQRFRQNSQSLIQIRRNELMSPLYTRVGQALDSVAQEKGYTQVLTMSAGLGYFDPAYDLTQAVADKMGVTLRTE